MSTDKYTTFKLSDSPIDYLFYLPFADLLLYPLRTIGFTPNIITVLSFITSLLGSYHILLNNRILSVILLNISYIFDCLDGKMARKYNMGSDFGMQLDLVSDNIGMIVLMICFFTKYKSKELILISLILYYLNSKWYGINEAISCYKCNGHDNFYKMAQDKFKNNNSLMTKLYLFIIKLAYKSYKLNFPKYDSKKMEKSIGFYRYFGPGTIFPLISLFILNTKSS